MVIIGGSFGTVDEAVAEILVDNMGDRARI